MLINVLFCIANSAICFFLLTKYNKRLQNYCFFGKYTNFLSKKRVKKYKLLNSLCKNLHISKIFCIFAAKLKTTCKSSTPY